VYVLLNSVFSGWADLIGMFKRIFIVISLLSVWSAHAHLLSLQDCLDLALEENADVVQARLARWVARDERGVVAGVYDTILRASGAFEESELPSQSNPFLGTSESLMMNSELSRTFSRGTLLAVGVDSSRSSLQAGEMIPFPSDLYSSIFRISASQPLLNNAWGALNRFRTEAAEYRYVAASARYEQTRQAVAGLVYALYWEAYAAEKRFETNERALAWSRSLIEVNRQRVADNLMDATELLAAEAALATREVDVLSAAAHRDRSREMLLDVIGLQPLLWDETRLHYPAEHVEVEKTVMNLEAFVAEALSMRSDLAALESERIAALREVELSRQSTRPNLSVGASYGIGSAGETSNDQWGTDRQLWMVGVQFEMPLERTADKSRLRQAERQVEIWESRYTHAARQVEMEIRDGMRRLATAREQVRATRKAHDLHEAKWQEESRKLSQGRSNTQLVIRYQEDLEHAEAAMVTAWASYEQAQAALLLARGILVPVAEARP